VSDEPIQEGYGLAWMHVVMMADSKLQCVLMQWWRHLAEALLKEFVSVIFSYNGSWLAGSAQYNLSPKGHLIVILGMGHSLENSKSFDY
jgi:hypothetical protein